MLLEHRLGREFPYDSVVVVSPHPDDSCIAAGGLLFRLSRENPRCRVHVIVMTSGHRGVTDEYLHTVLARSEVPATLSPKDRKRGLSLLNKKKRRRISIEEHHELSEMKARIRRHEVDEESRILCFTPHYLNLSIYDRHSVTEADRRRLSSTLKRINAEGRRHLLIHPGSYDIHETHRLCSHLIRNVIDSLYPEVYERWAYESPWTQVHIRSDIIVPLSDDALAHKIRATCVHRSQTDRTPYARLVEGNATMNAAVLSEILSSFDANHACRLGKHAEVFARQNDRTVYV